MIIFKIKPDELKETIHRWHNKLYRNLILEDIVSYSNNIFSPEEIDNNLKYIQGIPSADL